MSMAGKVFWIVWNKNKSEGVVFDNKDDAMWTARKSRIAGGFGEPAIGQAWRDTYGDDKNHVEAITIKPTGEKI